MLYLASRKRVQEMRRAAEAEARRQELHKRRRELQKQLPLLKCDSLVPEVCVEIYRRLMKQTPTDDERQR